MLLLIGALDPTGLSGLSRDAATAADLGCPAATVATALVAENSLGVLGVDWRPAAELLKDVKLVLAEPGLRLSAIKMGVVSAGQAAALWPLLKKTKAPVVWDPVLSATSGGVFVADPAALLPWLSQASLSTPNLTEARALLGRAKLTEKDLPRLGRAVLLKSAEQDKKQVVDWFFEEGKTHRFYSPISHENPRGTGCTLATAAAVFFSHGLPPSQAVKQARDYLSQARELAQGRRLGLVNAPKAEVLQALAGVTPLLERLPAKPLLAEVGLNLAYCLPGARGPEQAAAFTGRVTARHGLLSVTGYPAFEASSHVARVAVQAHQLFPSVRAAMNLRHSPELLKLAKGAGLKGVSFDRANEPTHQQHQDAHTMDWGVRAACGGLKNPPDVIFDGGGPGKEPMIRLLGRNPMDLVNKIQRVLSFSLEEKE